MGQRLGEATGMIRAGRNYSQGKKSSLEKKESGTSVWLMQGLPIEPVLEAEVQGNFFYSLVLDWTESFSQSQCLGRAAQRRPGKRDCWTYLRIGGWV